MTVIVVALCFGLVFLVLIALSPKKRGKEHQISTSSPTPADTHSGGDARSDSCVDSGSSGWFGGGGDSCGSGDGGGGGGD